MELKSTDALSSWLQKRSKMRYSSKRIKRRHQEEKEDDIENLSSTIMIKKEQANERQIINSRLGLMETNNLLTSCSTTCYRHYDKLCSKEKRIISQRSNGSEKIHNNNSHDRENYNNNGIKMNTNQSKKSAIDCCHKNNSKLLLTNHPINIDISRTTTVEGSGKYSIRQRVNREEEKRPNEEISNLNYYYKHEKKNKALYLRKANNSIFSFATIINIIMIKLFILVMILLSTTSCLFLLTGSNNNNFNYGVRAYQLTNNLIANNLPPKFITSGGSNSEIVVRVKEGSASIGKLIYTLKGEDPDEDPLTFGVLGSTASDLLRIENVPGNQANVYLRKELDRETTESHQVVITLTDGKLGRGNWVR